MYFFVGGTAVAVLLYAALNVAFSNRIDMILTDVEENLLQEIQGEETSSEKKIVVLKTRIIAVWKVLQKAYRAVQIFWSRVPTRLDLEHR